jgi:hypothetical protein
LQIAAGVKAYAGVDDVCELGVGNLGGAVGRIVELAAGIVVADKTLRGLLLEVRILGLRMDQRAGKGDGECDAEKRVVCQESSLQRLLFDDERVETFQTDRGNLPS